MHCIVEVVISQDLWIFHSLFGMAGSNNDLNVLDSSAVFNRLMEGKTPQVSYEMEMNMTSHIILLMSSILTGPHW
jgi:hypothetical protein